MTVDITAESYIIDILIIWFFIVVYKLAHRRENCYIIGEQHRRVF